MQNNNNIELSPSFPKKTSPLFFLGAFAWCRRFWRYLLFIVAYFYVGAARNWSQKRRTSPQGPKTEAESRGQRWTSWVYGAARRGAASEANAFWGL